MDDSTPQERGVRLGIDGRELRRRYNERLSDWSEPRAINVYRERKLPGLLTGPERVKSRTRIVGLP